MAKAALLLLALAFLQLTSASHFRYGTASYTRNGNQVTFTVTSGWRYATFLPDAVALGYTTELTLTVYVYTGTTLNALTRASVGAYGNPISDGLGGQYGLRTDVYMPVVVEGDGAKFLLADCCRILDLENAGNNPEQLWGTIDMRYGGSPMVSTAPIWIAPIGAVRSLNLNPTDQSGGQVRCTFTNRDPGCNLLNKYTEPSTRCAIETSGIREHAAVTTSLNTRSEVFLTGPDNCIVSWDLTNARASDQGKKWAISVYVNSTLTKASVPIDWIVILGASVIPQCSAADRLEYVINLKADIAYVFDEAVAMVMRSSNAPANYVLKFEQVNGLTPTGATFSPPPGTTTTDSGQTVRLSFSPSSSVGQYSMNFIFSDNLGGTCSQSIVIKVLAPLILKVEHPTGGVDSVSIKTAMNNLLAVSYMDPNPLPVVLPWGMVAGPTAANTAAEYKTTMADVNVGADRLKRNILNGEKGQGPNPGTTMGTRFVPAANIPCGATLTTMIAGNTINTFTCNGVSGSTPVADLCCASPPPPVDHLTVELIPPGAYLLQTSFQTGVNTVLAPTGSETPSILGSNPISVETVYLNGNIQAGVSGLHTDITGAGSTVLTTGQVPCGSRIVVKKGSAVVNEYSCQGPTAVQALCCPPPVAITLYVNISSPYYDITKGEADIAGQVKQMILPGLVPGSPHPDANPTPAPFPNPQSPKEKSVRVVYTTGILQEAENGISLLYGASFPPASILFDNIGAPCGSVVSTGIDASTFQVYSCDGRLPNNVGIAIKAPALCCPPLSMEVFNSDVGFTPLLVEYATFSLLGSGTSLPPPSGLKPTVTLDGPTSSPNHALVFATYPSGSPLDVDNGVQALNTNIRLPSPPNFKTTAQIPCGSRITVKAGNVVKFMYTCEGTQPLQGVGVAVLSLCCPVSSPPPPPVELFVTVTNPNGGLYPGQIKLTTENVLTIPGPPSGQAPGIIMDPNAGDSSTIVGAIYPSGSTADLDSGVAALDTNIVKTILPHFVSSAAIPCGSTIKVEAGGSVRALYTCSGGSGATAVASLCCASPGFLYVDVTNPSGGLVPGQIIHATESALTSVPPTSGLVPGVSQQSPSGGPPSNQATTAKAIYMSGNPTDMDDGVITMFNSITKPPPNFPSEAMVPCGSTIAVRIGSVVKHVYSCSGSTPPQGLGVAVSYLCCSPPPLPPLTLTVEIDSPNVINNVQNLVLPLTYAIVSTGLTPAPSLTLKDQSSSANFLTMVTPFPSANPAHVSTSVDNMHFAVTQYEPKYATMLTLTCNTKISVLNGNTQVYYYTCLGTASPMGGQAVAVPSLCCSPPPVSASPPPPLQKLSIKIDAPTSIVKPFPTVRTLYTSIVTDLSNGITPSVDSTSGTSPTAMLMDLTATYTSGISGHVDYGMTMVNLAVTTPGSTGFVAQSGTPCGSKITVSRDGSPTFVYSCAGSTVGGVPGVAVAHLCCSPPPVPAATVFVNVESPNGGLIPGQILTTTKNVFTAFFPDPNPTPGSSISGSPTGNLVSIATTFAGGYTDAMTGAIRIDANVQNGAPGNLGFFLPTAKIPCGSTVRVLIGSDVVYSYTCTGASGSVVQPILCCSPPPTARSPPPPPETCDGYYADKLRFDGDPWTFVFGKTKSKTKGATDTKDTKDTTNTKCTAKTKKTGTTKDGEDTKADDCSDTPVPVSDCCDQCATIKSCRDGSFSGFPSLQALRANCEAKFCTKVPAPPPAECNGFFSSLVIRNDGQNWDAVLFGPGPQRHLMTWGLFDKNGRKTYTYKKTVKAPHTGKTIYKYGTKTEKGGNQAHPSCCSQCPFISRCDPSMHPDGFCGYGSQQGVQNYCKSLFCPAEPACLKGWKLPSNNDPMDYKGVCTSSGGGAQCNAQQCAAGQCHGKCSTVTGYCPSSSCPGNDLGGGPEQGNCDNKYYKIQSQNLWSNSFKTKFGRRQVLEVASRPEERKLTSVSSCGFDVDAGFAFCNFKDYGKYMGEFPMTCNPDDKSRHCLGRIRCRASARSSTIVPCPAGIPEFADCFSDGSSANFKFCTYKC